MAQVEYVIGSTIESGETIKVSLDDLLSAFKGEAGHDTVDSDTAAFVHAEPAPENDKSKFDASPELKVSKTEITVTTAEPVATTGEQDDVVTHSQLYTVFDSFFERLREERLLPDKPQTETQSINLNVSDRTTEIEELKTLLIEAQETIIKLLTDRVEDRSKIAMLESQLKYLPMQKTLEAQAELLKSEQTLRLALATGLPESKEPKSRLRGTAGPSKPGLFDRLAYILGW